ncbi:hypothetical protein D4764_03G0012090 [Takifugu flavidus]|uniref:Reverse transcriptase domain-containing protein n=1 Tax=Takifugu flavidus TaxID=433684 RepID=A0A5C6NCL2_9TELE|nr:hypothetical protein D4764_03G0012090 [Takifugu flavidus]
MGKRFAPAYANIYMAEWEEGIFEKCQQQPLIYLRYLDDIWGIWSHSKTDFDDFVETMNQHHTSIKVEATLKDKEVNLILNRNIIVIILVFPFTEKKSFFVLLQECADMCMHL